MTVTVLPVDAMALQPMATSRIATNPHKGTVTTFDSRQLAELKASGDQPQAIQTVAEQFESLFLQMVLKQMRKASEALNADDDNALFGSREHKTYQEFFDGQIAIEMSKSQLGLAEVIVRQLGGEEGFKDASNEVALTSGKAEQGPLAGSAFSQSLLHFNREGTNA
ncbi:rod-binding protein [Photobacterium rosenbergii]|uniref:rod-binding protein n=1 Tax=Photobacterium rosenbergii TaxID=294936 RepID=UPI001C992612|nr:rod-binding protein [Photobacterium rosenbergii]MBY5947905.1 rod-binding protein [Photobacterium rosenbergii]